MGKVLFPLGMVMDTLAVIMPSIRGMQALPAIESALSQTGFGSVYVIVTGTSCSQDEFRKACVRMSSQIILGDPPNGDTVLPGRARNQGLAVLSRRFPDTDYLLMVDDDITFSPDSTAVLKSFLTRNPSAAAVMGRVKFHPAGYWSRVCDYSNFWWLQTKKDVLDRGFLCSGFTLLPYKIVKGIYFNESMRINEDTDYFKRLARISGRNLAVCGSVTSLHHHQRKTPGDWMSYVFQNGKLSTQEFHSSKVTGLSYIKGIRNMMSLTKKTMISNFKFLFPRPHLTAGILLFFTVYEIGILAGIRSRVQQQP